VVSLPRTGQAESYAAGDDGDLHTGKTWPDPRFSDNGDGTITDNLTGLMWERVQSGEVYTWINAINYCDKLNLGGHTDWRMPNINELETLENLGASNPASRLNSQGFSNLPTGHRRYWSSTTFIVNIKNAWTVSLQEGGIYDNGKKYRCSVIAVRNAQ
jgi:hypothetical protein